MPERSGDESRPATAEAGYPERVHGGGKLRNQRACQLGCCCCCPAARAVSTFCDPAPVFGFNSDGGFVFFIRGRSAGCTCRSLGQQTLEDSCPSRCSANRRDCCRSLARPRETKSCWHRSS